MTDETIEESLINKLMMQLESKMVTPDDEYDDEGNKLTKADKTIIWNARQGGRRQTQGRYYSYPRQYPRSYRGPRR